MLPQWLHAPARSPPPVRAGPGPVPPEGNALSSAAARCDPQASSELCESPLTAGTSCLKTLDRRRGGVQLSIVIAGVDIDELAAALSLYEAGRRDARMSERVADLGSPGMGRPASPALAARWPSPLERPGRAPGTSRVPGELAEQLDLSSSAISNLLRVMDSTGLVTRSPHVGNHRQVEVSASAKALDLFERFRPHRRRRGRDPACRGRSGAGRRTTAPGAPAAARPTPAELRLSRPYRPVKNAS